MGDTSTEQAYEEIRLCTPEERSLFTREHPLLHCPGVEVYFEREKYGRLPPDMREKLRESGWYQVCGVHADEGNVSFDLLTPDGTLECVCAWWFEKLRRPVR